MNRFRNGPLLRSPKGSYIWYVHIIIVNKLNGTWSIRECMTLMGQCSTEIPEGCAGYLL